MTEKAAPPELTGWKKLAVDFGPLLIFFAAYSRFDIYVGTAAFMAATAIAMAAAWLLIRRIPAMTWFSALLVGVFGGLTLWLKDETFIKIKPTIVFLILSAILFFGLLRKRNYLKSILGTIYEGLTERGWELLAWRWAFFFLVLALLNEIFWRFFPTDIWLHFKLWGDTLLTFVFAIAQAPMLMRHGLKLDDKKKDDNGSQAED
ncbi:septation protein A [Sandaracinobacter sp. RS1-74]|uniref:septation protein A n=1 Tax=Sandaracinobacteroides sayramensis TaxID=2913411 RepID=UPI001ED9F578|nr:septation protein A [Sandaracinobacteroides sayramensis]MCG2841557.1 septation protein A [Sandaracinobacteroides sayramensis]